MTKKVVDNIEIDLTPEEQTEYDAKVSESLAKVSERKLNYIREIRNKKLKETDFYALDDVVMSDLIKTKRQEWRDIPSTYTTEAEYDELLAKDDTGKLTHSIWENHNGNK